MERSSQYHHSRANQGRDRVELGSQHGGNFHHEDVAHHAAADSGQHTGSVAAIGPASKILKVATTKTGLIQSFFRPSKVRDEMNRREWSVPRGTGPMTLPT
jgi:hypothetical protein